MNIKRQVGQVDIYGLVLIVVSTTLILMGFDIISTSAPFVGVALVLLAVGISILVAFIYVESRKKTDPLISVDVLKQHNVSFGMISALCTGVIIYASIFLFPQYYRAVYNSTPIQAGLMTWPWVVGVGVSSISCGLAISLYGNFRPYLIVGGGLLVVGFSLLTTFEYSTKIHIEYLYTFIVGLGIGFRLPSVTIEAQAVVSHKDLASVTSLVTFSRSMGGVLGLAISKGMQKNVMHRLAEELLKEHSEWYDEIEGAANGLVYKIFQITDEEVRKRVVESFINSIVEVFYVCIGFSVVALVTSVLAHHVDLYNTAEEKEMLEKRIEELKKASKPTSVKSLPL